MKLIKIPFEEAIEGEMYLSEMKHGWISGRWDSTDKTCNEYYWREMSWYPHVLYKIVTENDTDIT